MGGLTHFFPRTGIRQNDPEWHDPAENLLRSTRKTSDASLVTWLDAKLRDSDDDGDGGGTAA